MAYITKRISKKRTSVLFKVQKRGDVKVSNVTCGYALSSAAIELPRIPAFYPKKTPGPPSGPGFLCKIWDREA